MGKIQIRIDIESETLKELNIPESILKAFIQKRAEFDEENDLGSYKNIAKRTRKQFLECMMKSNEQALSLRELAKLSGYSVKYTKRILQALMQDKEVIKQRFNAREYRYLIAPATARAIQENMTDDAATEVGTARSKERVLVDTNGAKVVYVESSQKAKSTIQKMMRKANKPLTMEDIIYGSVYCRSYCHKTIKTLLAEGLVDTVWKKNTPYYKLTATAMTVAGK